MRIFVVGYGTYWQPGGCRPLDPIWAADADNLQPSWDLLHTMLAEQAAAHGAGFIDLRTPSAEHGVCALIDQRWMEGLQPSTRPRRTTPTQPA